MPSHSHGVYFDDVVTVERLVLDYRPANRAGTLGAPSEQGSDLSVYWSGRWLPGDAADLGQTTHGVAAPLPRRS